VQKVNGKQFGNLTDLGSFLFGRERGDLEAYRPILRDIQSGRCFYCRKDLRQRMEVDHFVPWSRYPMDLGHNFVLAHPSCNNAKSDHIGNRRHPRISRSIQISERAVRGESPFAPVWRELVRQIVGCLELMSVEIHAGLSSTRTRTIKPSSVRRN